MISHSVNTIMQLVANMATTSNDSTSATTVASNSSSSSATTSERVGTLATGVVASSSSSPAASAEFSNIPPVIVGAGRWWHAHVNAPVAQFFGARAEAETGARVVTESCSSVTSSSSGASHTSSVSSSSLSSLPFSSSALSSSSQASAAHVSAGSSLDALEMVLSGASLPSVPVQHAVVDRELERAMQASRDQAVQERAERQRLEQQQNEMRSLVSQARTMVTDIQRNNAAYREELQQILQRGVRQVLEHNQNRRVPPESVASRVVNTSDADHAMAVRLQAEEDRARREAEAARRSREQEDGALAQRLHRQELTAHHRVEEIARRDEATVREMALRERREQSDRAVALRLQQEVSRR